MCRSKFGDISVNCLQPNNFLIICATPLLFMKISCDPQLTLAPPPHTRGKMITPD